MLSELDLTDPPEPSSERFAAMQARARTIRRHRMLRAAAGITALLVVVGPLAVWAATETFTEQSRRVIPADEPTTTARRLNTTTTTEPPTTTATTAPPVDLEADPTATTVTEPEPEPVPAECPPENPDDTATVTGRLLNPTGWQVAVAYEGDASQGQPVELAEDGTFTTTVPCDPNSKPVQIILTQSRHGAHPQPPRPGAWMFPEGDPFGGEYGIGTMCASPLQRIVPAGVTYPDFTMPDDFSASLEVAGGIVDVPGGQSGTVALTVRGALNDFGGVTCFDVATVPGEIDVGFSVPDLSPSSVNFDLPSGSYSLGGGSTALAPGANRICWYYTSGTGNNPMYIRLRGDPCPPE